MTCKVDGITPPFIIAELLMRLPMLAPFVTLVFVANLHAAEPTSSRTAKLAVLVVFDQMRGDFLDKWQHLFVDDGFKRLQSEGAWFDNCHYPYSMTSTGPGHASMLSGCSGDRHGIVANNWYDRKSGANQYCASSERYERVPPIPGKPQPPRSATETKSDDDEKPKGFGAPTNMLAPTLGDVIKEVTQGRGRVFGLSLKDRSAILPSGKKPDGCYWFSGGQFVTSTYYRDRLHPWVARFNEARSFDRWFGQQWDRLRSDLDYTTIVGPDDGPGEGEGAGDKKGPKQGVTFPHSFALGEKLDANYYSAIANSPFGNEVLFELAQLAVVEEQLGQRDVPDLLVVSFSSNDLVGHCWGPDSHEVLDVTLRSDRIVRELLKFLDEKVGKGNYAIGLTADHGICPLPELTISQGRPAGRVHPNAILNEAEIHLRKKFGASGKIEDKKTRYIEAANEGGIYLNDRVIAARMLKMDVVAGELAEFLTAQPEIELSLTRSQVEAIGDQSNAMLRSIRKCYHPERVGDVIVVTKPNYLLTSYKTGTSHGTPHAYDSHVPLIVFGPGVRSGRRHDRVTPQAAAASLARAIGVPVPAMAEAPLPDKLFE